MIETDTVIPAFENINWQRNATKCQADGLGGGFLAAFNLPHAVGHLFLHIMFLWPLEIAWNSLILPKTTWHRALLLPDTEIPDLGNNKTSANTFNLRVFRCLSYAYHLRSLARSLVDAKTSKQTLSAAAREAWSDGDAAWRSTEIGLPWPPLCHTPHLQRPGLPNVATRPCHMGSMPSQGGSWKLPLRMMPCLHSLTHLLQRWWAHPLWRFPSSEAYHRFEFQMFQVLSLYTGAVPGILVLQGRDSPPQHATNSIHCIHVAGSTKDRWRPQNVIGLNVSSSCCEHQVCWHQNIDCWGMQPNYTMVVYTQLKMRIIYNYIYIHSMIIYTYINI